MSQPTIEEVIEYAKSVRRPAIDDAEIRSKLDAFFKMSQIALSTVYEAAHYGNLRCQNAVFELDKLRALLK